VYPELVIRNSKGEIQGVRYEELAPMLLNEMQKQQRTLTAQSEQAAVQAATIHSQADRIETQAAEIRDLKAQHEEMSKQLAELSDLKQEVHAALRQLKAHGELVAQR
jgi:hypothetical protein